MKTRLLSVLLVFLLVTSVTIPTATADSIDPFIDPFDPSVAFFHEDVEDVPENLDASPVNQFLVVNPVTVKLACDGIIVLVSIFAAMEIGNHLGKTWDGNVNNLQKFASDVGSALNGLFSVKKWVYITSSEGKTLITAVYDCYTATSGGCGKKDDKWYFKARKNEFNGKIEINTERIDESQALKAMRQGNDIMTLNKELVKNLVGRFEGLSKEAIDDLDFETHHGGAEGHFPHLHYYVKYMRLHCWNWT